MKKRFSIYHFLIAVLIFSMFSPVSSVFATVNGDGNGDEETTGSLTIHKFEQEKGDKTGDGDGNPVDPDSIKGEPLEGVEYTITQTHSYDPETDTWTSVSGSPKTYTTNEDGKIVINNIDLGRYTVQETAWPKNVVGDGTEYSVDIPMTSKDGSSVNYDVHIYPKNEIIRGKVKLIKYDGDECQQEVPQLASTNGDVTDCKTLEGVTFNLYKEGNDDPIKTGLTTNNHGFIIVDNLAYGNYYFQETDTIEGYLINGEKVRFSIEHQGQKEVVVLDNYVKPGVKKDVDKWHVNRGEEVEFTITVQLPGDITSYESFNITDTLSEGLVYVDGSETSSDAFDFSKDGQTLTWEATPSQLEPGEVSITFKAKVTEEAEANEPIPNVANIDYNNEYQEGGDPSNEVTVTPTVGSLKVKKVDGDSGDGLAGAEFELRDMNGKVVAKGTSDENGNVDFSGATDELGYGFYELVETKAPEGYTLLRNPKEIHIHAKEQDLEITVDNFASGWDLPKTGGIGTTLFTAIGTLLMGLAFYLYTRRRKETA